MPGGPLPQRTLDDFPETGVADSLDTSSEPAPIDRETPEGELLLENQQGLVDHPLLSPNLVRAYPFQMAIAKTTIADNTLAVLPTGLGKTVIAALVAAERLRCKRGKVLFLAPTRPLVQQHAKSFAGVVQDAYQGHVHRHAGVSEARGSLRTR